MSKAVSKLVSKKIISKISFSKVEKSKLGMGKIGGLAPIVPLSPFSDLADSPVTNSKDPSVGIVDGPPKAWEPDTIKSSCFCSGDMFVVQDKVKRAIKALKGRTVEKLPGEETDHKRVVFFVEEERVEVEVHIYDADRIHKTGEMFVVLLKSKAGDEEVFLQFAEQFRSKVEGGPGVGKFLW